MSTFRKPNRQLVPLLWLWAASILIGLALGAGIAKADPIVYSPDPHVPIASMGWCPGGGFASGFGSYCDGTRFADGSFWHSARVLGFWQMNCVVDNGTMIPDPAPAGGCGGAA